MSDEELKKVANEVRKGIVTGVHAAKSGHPGGSLGAADIMTYLYFEEMNVDPADPRKADRDRFVLSKGHCAPGLYAVLAERGFFPKEDLETLRHIGSHLQGHPNMNDTPGVDMSTGSLGQGISAAVGMAVAATQAQGRFGRLPGNLLSESGTGSRSIFLHVDSRSKRHQTDVFFYHAPNSANSKRLATTMKNTFESKYDKHQPNRGFTGTVGPRNLYVLANSTPAGVFVELGNIQNTFDQRRFVISSNRQALAKWMMEGFITDYKKSK